MARIHLLPDTLISKIAAGEVVERPASVVKELIENSLDAGAGEVRIEVEAGGKRRIVVHDDGSGMASDDALLAFDRHATSKIESFDDLERVATLGFRGEALASIASVARVELVTATDAGEGYRVRIEGGRVLAAEPAARARGTTVEVASLFYNVPARRKFLKQPATELRRTLEVVQGYALARPDVGFRLTHQGRSSLEALAVGGGLDGTRERIAQIFGRELAERLVEIPSRKRGAERIGGFVGNPETTKGRRLFLFVNRRLLRDRAVLAIFYRAVRAEWKSDDFPALFLFLDLPPEEVDVNVHPQKAEVRFRDPRLLGRVSAALRDALAAARGEEPAPLVEAAVLPRRPFAWQGLGERGFGGASGGGARSYLSSGEAGDWQVRQGGAPAAADGLPPARLAEASLAPVERPVVPLSGRGGEARPFRLLGQYKGTLILLEGEDGLYLIDQHVAHERILYERLRRTLAREATPSQGLVTPMLLEVGPAERLRLLEIAESLEAAGFSLAELSGGTLGLTAIPAVLSPAEAEALVLQLAEEDSTGDLEAQGLDQTLLDALAASLSCKQAVKMHHPLAAEEMEAVVAELFAAEQPHACPHGRPIILKMTDSDLERRFGRR